MGLQTNTNHLIAAQYRSNPRVIKHKIPETNGSSFLTLFRFSEKIAVSQAFFAKLVGAALICMRTRKNRNYSP